MRKMFFAAILSAGCLLVVPLAVSAQEADEVGTDVDIMGEGEAGQKIEYQKKTVIDFEDDTIKGSLTTPDIDYIEARKKIKMKSLIRIREDFRLEILKSVGDL